MRTRNPRVRRQIQKEKGDLLAQKWMTNLLAFILIVLIIAFVVLSIPSVKKHIIEFIRVLRFGREQVPQPPQLKPINPFYLIFALKGNIHAYQMDTL